MDLDSLNVYAHALHELGKARANADDIFAGLREVYARCKGGYACVAMITGFGILGFRYALLSYFAASVQLTAIAETRMVFALCVLDRAPLPPSTARWIT